MSRAALALVKTRTNLIPEIASIPAQLARQRCWITWKFEAKPGSSKAAKVPYRLDGRRRYGEQGSSDDRDGWGSLVQAIEAARARGHDGIGFALHEHASVVALDFDHVIASNGEIHAEVSALIAGTYAEVSPSGEGIRAFYSRNGSELSNGKAHGGPFGFETFTTAGFVTVTGRHLNGHAYPLTDNFPLLPAHVRDYALERLGSSTVKRLDTALASASQPAVATAGEPIVPSIVPGDYFATVNQTALQYLDRWVPALHPNARCRRGRWRVESADLDRDLQEAFSFTTQGIKDFGVHDMGDARQGRRTPIDAVLCMAHFFVDPEGLEITNATDAARWLCETMGVDPSALGWRETASFKGGGGTFDVRASGVTFKGDDPDQPAVPVCGWLRVVAMSRDVNSRQWGRAVEWFDPDEQPHSWTMPAALLEGDGLELRRQFREGGLEIARPVRGRGDLFLAMLAAWPTDSRLRAVTCTGWHGSAFVLPDQVIGEPKGERITLQSEQPVAPAYANAGTLESWCDQVGILANGNALLMFAISVAFAAPMLNILGEQSGGVHLHGASTTGKTTTMRAAASVYGHPERYVRTWRATANGLEGIAAVHSDVLLALDEIGEANPDEVGSVVYLLANESGKMRSARSGLARPSHRWRVLYLSSGETPLVEVVRQGRLERSIRTGQELRLADVAVPPEGVFTALHGSNTPAEFARRLADGFAANYGHVGVAWIRNLSTKRAEHASKWREQARQWVDGATSANTHAQALRVARRFALAAVAGETATDAGLTGWAAGAASKAALIAFNRWHEGFGNGASEFNGAIQRLYSLVTREGGRFEALGSGRPHVQNRAGFYDDTGLAFVDEDGLDPRPRLWLVLRDVFAREVCNGCDQRAIARELCGRGILVGQAGKSTQKRRIPNLGSATYRVYVVDGQAIADATSRSDGD